MAIPSNSYINPATKEVVRITGVNTVSKTFDLESRADKFAEPTYTTVSFEQMNTEAYHKQFFVDLQASGLYTGFVAEDVYVDWPTDTELPEYNANYRISLTNEQVVFVTKSATYRDMILDIKEDHTKDHSKGIYVYLTEFKPYHPWVIVNALGLKIDSNPNKPVPPIDMTPPPTPPANE